MKDITYSLCEECSASDGYYNEISSFTNEVIDKINEMTFETLECYKNYVTQNETETPMDKIVYGFEILMIGVLWVTYIKKALSLDENTGIILTKLVCVREKNSYIKGIVDKIRGAFATKLLLKEKLNSEEIDSTIDNLYKLINWLKASGEFSLEAERIEKWYEYLDSEDTKESNNIISKVIELGQWFQIRSNEVLGEYTKNVELFIKENYQRVKWKEHIIFCSRERVEYHLNMVGAEIMNRAFREDFLKTKEKRVLLPICMRYKSYGECKALKTDVGYLCAGCSNKCRINELTILGRKYNFKVYIIPHASSAFTKQKQKKGEIGIVGIACVLNLISGGYKAKQLGFEPQCVLLDYCGCKKHWHESGIVTDIDLKRLKKVLQIPGY